MIPPQDPYQALAGLKAALAARQEGRVSNYRVTPAGLWTRSDLDEVLELFIQLDLGQYQRMVDLGSGDGRVVCLASCFTGWCACRLRLGKENSWFMGRVFSPKA